jgi:hypothetical protein
MQRPLPDDTQHSKETDIHIPGGIQTHNPRKQAATDPCLRMHGHWEQQNINLLSENINDMDNNSYWVPLRTFIETNMEELKDTFNITRMQFSCTTDPNTALGPCIE